MAGIRPTAIKNKKCVLVGLNKYIIPLYISSQALPSYVFLTACWLRSTTPRRKILFGRLDLILQRSVRSFRARVNFSALCAKAPWRVQRVSIEEGLPIYLGWVTLNYLCRPLIIVQDAFYVQSRGNP